MSCCDDGFRLPAASECSLRSKARIDALFEDTRSMCCGSSLAAGSYCAGGVGSRAATAGDDVDEDQQQRRVNSAVQARIEAMFASVEAESAAPGECAAAVLPVKYMGAAPVGGRVASVRGLQEPLRQLVERIGESVNAELEVSRRGLTFRTSELHEKNNPFRRIAVWSALKLQTRRRPGSNSNTSQDVLHAFVPLVADDRAQGLGPVCSGATSTGSINTAITNIEDRHADLYRTMRGLGSRDVTDYPPIFAVVMRRPGAARLLECHAFACRCEEDAIAAAATLYRALLADLDATARRPRLQRNGLGCASLASVVSSCTRETSPTGHVNGSARRRRVDLCSGAGTTNVTKGTTERIVPPPPPSPPVAHHPVRPPRVKKTSISSSVNTEDEQSSSSPCGNVGPVDKAPRRKKKCSEIKAEDVLEARSRRLLSPSRDSCSPNESSAITRRSENSSSSASSRLETSEERRMNAKNKIYGARAPQCLLASSGEVQVIEKLYDERKPGEPYGNENERSSSDRERSGSYDFDCCTENSLYESSRIYAKARAAEAKSKSEQKLYEVTRPSSHSTPSRKLVTSSSSGRRDAYATRPAAPTPCCLEEPTYVTQQQRRRSIASSVGSSNVARHRDHFRDADKIYSLGPEEIYVRGVHANDRIYDVTRPGRQSGPSIRSDISVPSVRSTTKRLGRVATMDRPLRRPSLDASIEQTSLHHRPQQPTPHRSLQQQQQQQQQTRQEPQRQQRRRSRAGSEPPTSRTDAAAAAAATTAALMRRSQSELDLDRGDPLTRVELPRRGSFLKPGSVRKRNGIEGGGAGTPLGFTELFDEFRNQEGLTSVDDILAAIIDPEGMSFNDLKPLYKEFLLKLAATLTQDELYQRSASIMRRRRRPLQRRRSSRASGNGGAGGGAGRPCLLRRAIKRSVSRLRSSSAGGPTEFTSVLFPARRLNDRSSFGSSSSCDVMKSAAVAAVTSGHHHRSSNGNRVLASKLGRRRSTNTRCSSSKSRMGHTTSEDSDTCRRVSRGIVAANRSSSGYVSCSECSYDSESCTCVSADKCYCSLSRKPTTGTTGVESHQTGEIGSGQAAVLCSCDTDSCSESNKCYCARKPAFEPGQPSILEQLRQKGIVPSESTLSRGASPDRTKNTRASRSLATSKSLEYLKVRSSSVRGSTDNLALDYELFTPGGRRSSQCSSSSEKVLVVSARDPQGRLIYVGGDAGAGKRSSRHYCQGSGGNGAGGDRRHRTTGSSGHHEALSIKKSAEIAAVFGGGQPRIGRRASSTSSLRSSVSLEAGLGYLP